MKVTIDGHIIEVDAGTTIMEAARKIGGDVVPPSMCYYSKLKDCGGKCRCCLVEVVKGSEKDPRPMPKLQASCVTPIQDGMEVKSNTSERAKTSRKAVTEFLLINHPLDCPVCDQAGECKLQDLAMQTGNYKSRFIEKKRTFTPENVGPYVQFHMNRCILCYRCVKLADQITEERFQGVINRGLKSQISTYIHKVIDNDFSGNMIDICPVGAVTDKTYRFQSRVWFNKPMDAHRECTRCSGKVVLWMFGDIVQRVTTRTNEYNEMEDFICNECRFHKKDKSHWIIEGPRKIKKSSVISVNNYTDNLKKIEIEADKLILEGREQDHKKISMKDKPYDENH